VVSDILTSSAPIATRRLTRAEAMMASARIPNSSANLQDRFIPNNVQVPSEILKDHEPISIPSSEVYDHVVSETQLILLLGRIL
jgi:hypothetical protein